ncbi:ATP-dependent nuclease [Rahnella bonaserana]|uniref:AAA family ATPase n=1 Tax=Rahnella bonaserana TaxID=2816248 RepID=A0ABS6LSD7_9GAMM|nr:AAA family ATPase [Rahnella bonaserana]MBU9855018.1 AAA family ATPase [Rahnella bonaserana]
MELVIKVLHSIKDLPQKSTNTLYLIEDNWDDWGTFNSKYYAIFFNRNSVRVDLGYLKIGCPENKLINKRPDLPAEFLTLPPGYYSLGQGENYYSNIVSLTEVESSLILDKINDVVFDESLYLQHQDELAMTDSLQRYVSTATIKGQFHNILRGKNRLTRFYFSYKKNSGTIINFEVNPYSTPPTNMHVIIGSNGVGKTTILNDICEVLTKSKTNHSDITMDTPGIANVIAMSFGTFEKFNPTSLEKLSQNSVTYSYIGSKKTIKINDREMVIGKTIDDFFDEFVDSLKACNYEPRKSLLKRSIENLKFDPILNQLGIEEILNSNANTPELKTLFYSLSSGHKIVILSITKLIEVIEEKTLLLIDEPETHLHPPLLSALIRLISELLKECNGLAIIATHSPVVLQETPKRCVTVLSRFGDNLEASRPEIETFGENVSVLTRSVFNLELSRTGYVKIIMEKIKENKSFNKIYSEFNGEVGGEALAIISALSDDDEGY